MTDITNADRAAWAATAIEAFTAECRMDGEDNQTKAKDLATNLVHFLRLECGLSLEEAGNVISNAVAMAEVEVAEDEDGEEDEPVEREYGVRIWATFRTVAETTVTATSFEEAVKKAEELELTGPVLDFSFAIPDGNDPEGDETVHVFGPDDADLYNEDPWEGEGFEVDRRKDGEPFSWDACAIVKDLAAMEQIVAGIENSEAIEIIGKEETDKLKAIVARAKAACTKGA